MSAFVLGSFCLRSGFALGSLLQANTKRLHKGSTNGAYMDYSRVENGF